MKTSSFLALGALCLSSLAHADDPVRTPVPDARPVMFAALRATDGKAYGVLTGEMADAITRRFGATSPILIDVTTEKHYAQPGCSRLNLPGPDATMTAAASDTGWMHLRQWPTAPAGAA